jgi:hypothetical protein
VSAKSLTAKISLIILFFAVYAAASESYNVNKVNVLKGSTLTVSAPCEVTPVFNPDIVAVEGRGRIVTIYPIDSTTVSLICEGGDSGYVVVINVQPEPAPGQSFFLEIKDKEYREKQRKIAADAVISSYNAEQILSEARRVLVGMVKRAEVSGYETNKSPNVDVQKRENLEARLLKTYKGNLLGLAYEITNKSNLRIRKNVSDFSTRGVIFVYSPSALKNGDMVIPANGRVVIYIVKTDGASANNLAAAWPWIGGGSSPQASLALPALPPTSPAAAPSLAPAGDAIMQSAVQHPAQETLDAMQAIDMNQVIPFLRGR